MNTQEKFNLWVKMKMQKLSTTELEQADQIGENDDDE